MSESIKIKSQPTATQKTPLVNAAFDAAHQTRIQDADMRCGLAEAKLARAEDSLRPFVAARDTAAVELREAREAAEQARRYPRRDLTEDERVALHDAYLDLEEAAGSARFHSKPGPKTTAYVEAVSEALKSLTDRVQFLPDILGEVAAIRVRLGIPAKPRVKSDAEELREDVARERAVA